MSVGPPTVERCSGDDERRGGDPPLDLQPAGQSLGEGRLAGAEGAVEDDHVPGLQGAAQLLGESLGVLGGGQFTGAFRGEAHRSIPPSYSRTVRPVGRQMIS